MNIHLVVLWPKYMNQSSINMTYFSFCRKYTFDHENGFSTMHRILLSFIVHPYTSHGTTLPPWRTPADVRRLALCRFSIPLPFLCILLDSPLIYLLSHLFSCYFNSLSLIHKLRLCSSQIQSMKGEKRWQHPVSIWWLADAALPPPLSSDLISLFPYLPLDPLFIHFLIAGPCFILAARCWSPDSSNPAHLSCGLLDPPSFVAWFTPSHLFSLWIPFL